MTNMVLKASQPKILYTNDQQMTKGVSLLNQKARLAKHLEVVKHQSKGHKHFKVC